jgi:Tol biopolymer transport system component
MWERKIGLAILLSIAVVAIFATPAQATFPGFNGRIAQNGINLVYPNGRDPIGLSYGDDSEPSWSSDGTKVVVERFTTDEDPPNGYILNANGSGETLLSNAMVDPSWSPDSTKVVFRNRTFPNGIAVINADGTGRTVLVADQIGNWNIQPAWSPDGQKIVFVRCQPAGGSNCDIYTMNPDGTGLTNITNNGLGNRLPSWSPDASKIAFQRGSSPSGIWVMDATGANPTQIGSGFNPVWSPDGQQIAFASCGGSLFCSVHLMHADGSGDRLVFPRTYGSLDWEPCAAPCPPPPLPPYDTPIATPYFSVPLVPNFRQTISNTQCTARGGTASTHGAPLALQSCNPPGYVPGTIAHLRNDPNQGVSYANFYPRYGDLTPGDTADLFMEGNVGDVRTAAGTDYTQSVTVITKLRITDTDNGAASTDPGTVADFDFSLPVFCFALAGPAGGRCSYGTGADAVTPGMIKERKDMVLQIFRVRVNDSGADGVRGNADDRTFATQGIYIR